MAGRQGNTYLRTEDLDRFVKQVDEMRREGLQTWEIANLLGVSKSTLRLRVQRFRESHGVAVTHFRIKRVFDGATRYIGRDKEGWHTTGVDRAYVFITEKEAEKCVDALVFHGHAREWFTIEPVKLYDVNARDRAMSSDPSQERGCA
jgi:hypothetical protein